jgi:hypothetical protein
MAVVPLPIDPGAQARVLLHPILRHGDIVGQDSAGRILITLALDAWTLDQLLTFDASSEDLEDADGEPEPDQEIDGPPVSGLELAPSKMVRCALLTAPRRPASMARTNAEQEPVRHGPPLAPRPTCFLDRLRDQPEP